MTHKELAIQAFENMLGDNLYRAKEAFLGMNDEQMKQQYGQSGKTRAEILADYAAHYERVNAAISWIRGIP